MFTGLVEATGELLAIERSAAGARLAVGSAIVPELGESIAVNGCCLTAVDPAAGRLHFDLLEETLRRTNLGALRPGDPVNLERALRADGRLGGHFVQGHIDATGEVVSFERQGADFRLEAQFPEEFAPYVVEKGSICLDGISLTVAEAGARSLAVWVIPHTLERTNLRLCRAGARVNLEFDLLAKYVERMLSLRSGSARALANPGPLADSPGPE